jgi:hypothetical protein
MMKLLRKLFRRRAPADHLCAHARVAEVYRCRCGDTFVKERH